MRVNWEQACHRVETYHLLVEALEDVMKLNAALSDRMGGYDSNDSIVAWVDTALDVLDYHVGEVLALARMEEAL